MALDERSISRPWARRAAGSVAALLGLAIGLSMLSCAGARKPEREQAHKDQRGEPGQPVEPLGPRTPTDEPQASSDPAPAAPETTSPATPRPAPSVARVPNGGRDDGRPNWWFAESRTEDGEIRLCAEALGADMASARDAALQAARIRLRQELALGESQPIPQERIERAWVWPLPNTRVGPSRYAGYVLIGAPKP